ncbi:hypothetical protein ACOSQ2_004001 [Xanthoceras sorbifolium]
MGNSRNPGTAENLTRLLPEHFEDQVGRLVAITRPKLHDHQRSTRDGGARRNPHTSGLPRPQSQHRLMPPAGNQTSLVRFLSARHDSFAWSHTDMTGIDPEVLVHKL